MSEPVSPGAALAALRRPKRLQCAVCGRTFTGAGRARYCSNACRQRAWQRAHKRDRSHAL